MPRVFVQVRLAGAGSWRVRAAVTVVSFLVALVVLDLADASGVLLVRFVEAVGRDGLLLSAFVLFVLLRGPVPGMMLPASTRIGRSAQMSVRIGFLTVATATMLAFGEVVPAVLPWVSGGVGIALVLAVVALVQRARSRRGNPFELIELPVGGMFTMLLVLATFGPSFSEPVGTPLRAGLVAICLVYVVLFFAPRFQSWRAGVPAGRWFTLGGAVVAGVGVAIEGAVSLSLTVRIGLVVLPALVVFSELWELIKVGADRVPIARYLAGFEGERQQVLHRIKGNYRRSIVAEDLDSDERLPESWKVHSLGEGDKMWLQAQHPHARGGEDLPDLQDGEVEIARLSYTDTVHGEVVSLRVRCDESGTRYNLRLVDEYDTQFMLPVSTVEGALRSDDILAIYRDAVPSPMDVGSGYRFQSFFHPDLVDRSSVDRDALRQLLSSTGWFSIGFGVRTWARRIAVSSARTARAVVDLAGRSSGYEAAAWGFTAGTAYRLTLMAAESIEADWLSAVVAVAALAPVPALVVRRLRDIRLERLRQDLRWLSLPFAAGTGLLLLGRGAPLGWAIAIPALFIAMLYLILRPGDVDPLEALDLNAART